MTNAIKQIALFLLGMMLIALSFGESVTLFGFNLSWIFAAVIAALMIFHLLISIGSKQKSESTPKGANNLLIFAYIWLGYSVLQGLWAKDLSIWTQGIISTFVNIFIIVVLWYFLKSNSDIDSFLKYSVPLWVMNIALGLYEIITNNHFVEANVTDILSKSVVRTFFGNPNDCATWIVLSFLLLSCYLKKLRLKHVFTLAAWALTTFVVTETDSRACLLGMIAYIVIYTLSYFITKTESKTSRGVFKTLFVIGAVAVLAIIFVGIYGDLASSLILNYSGENNQTSDFFRLEIIKDTINTIFNSFFLGVGANQTVAYIGINPHNFFLELLSDFGLVIFMFACYFLYRIINAFFSKETPPHIRSYYLSYAVTFITISISSSSMNRLRLAWVSLVVIFLAVCYGQSKCEKEPSEAKKSKWLK